MIDLTKHVINSVLIWNLGINSFSKYFTQRIQLGSGLRLGVNFVSPALKIGTTIAVSICLGKIPCFRFSLHIKQNSNPNKSKLSLNICTGSSLYPDDDSFNDPNSDFKDT